MPSIKSKNEKLSLKQCTNCFKANSIVFNFAHLMYEDMDNNSKIALVDRIIELSSVNYLELSRWPKEKGFEEIKIKINKKIPESFLSEIGSFDGKFSVIRLYKNNEPTPGRIIGKIVNKVFYIFYIDVKGKLYEH